MKVYVKFFDGENEALASDSMFILDGRNTKLTWISDARERMDRLINVQSYNGFEIRTCTGRAEPYRVVYKYP